MANVDYTVKYNPLSSDGEPQPQSPRLVAGKAKWIHAYDDDRGKSAQTGGKRKKTKQRSGFKQNDDSDTEMTHIDLFEPGLDTQLGSPQGFEQSTGRDLAAEVDAESSPFREQQHEFAEAHPATTRSDATLGEYSTNVEPHVMIEAVQQDTPTERSLLSELEELRKRVETLESLSPPQNAPKPEPETPGCWRSCLTACESVRSPTCLPCPSICERDEEELIISTPDEEEEPTPSREPTPPPTPVPTPAPSVRSSHHSDDEITEEPTTDGGASWPDWITPPIEITAENRQVYKAVFDRLYQEAVDDDEEKCACGVNCICPAEMCKCCPDGCFEKASQIASFDCRSLIRTDKGKKKVVTAEIRKARSAGWRIIAKLAFPLVHHLFRDLWVLGEWLFVLLGFILSIVSFVQETDRRAFNYLHLVLISLAFILASLDTVITLLDCKSCIACSDVCKRGRFEACCTKMQETFKEGIADKVPAEAKKCWLKTEETRDIIRIVAAEVLFYPLLMCDLFEFIIDTGRTGQFDFIDTILFLLGIFSLVFYVYILRLYILGTRIMQMNSICKPKTKNVKETNSQDQKEHSTNISSEQDQSDSTAKTNVSSATFPFLSYFFVHVLLQMIAQICMIVAIAFKIYEDNKDTAEPIKVSGPLWFLLIAGFFIPPLGILSFFIPTYFWAFIEFPSSVVFDLLSILEMPGVDHVLYADQNRNEIIPKLRKFLDKFNQAEYKEGYEKTRNKSLFEKVTYPFTQVHLVLLSMLYTGLHLAFILTTIISLKVAMYGALYVGLIFIDIFANYYIFAIGGFWILVILK